MKLKLLSTLSICVLCTATLFAQERKDYYDNGNLKFKGKYQYTWKEEDANEYDIAINAEYRNTRSSHMDDFEYISNMRNLLPGRTFDGLCTFYYPNGSKHFEGKYAYGVKNGKFTYWNSEGKKTAELYFKNGMADGQWLYWDENKNLRQEFNYKALDTAQLAKYSSLLFSRGRDRDRDDEDNDFLSFRERKPFRKSKYQTIDAYRERTRVFEDFIQNNLFGPTIFDGKFMSRRKDQPYLEFYYKQNVPVGIWRIYDNQGKPAFECSFENGEVSKIQEFEHPEYNKRAEEYVERQKQDSIRRANWGKLNNSPGSVSTGSDNPDAVDPGIPPAQSPTFTSVEQMPEFPGGQAALAKYVATHLNYPKAALKDSSIAGRVYVQFVVQKDGTIGTIKVVRGLGHGTDEEAIRVVKSMPNWKPGKQNGQAVAVYYTLPVTFSLKK